MIEDASILFSVEDSVAVVRLNRPKALNAVNRTMRERLLEVFLEADRRADVRVLVLLGEGKAFCAGQDLKEGGEPRTAAQTLRAEQDQDFQGALASMRKPTVVGLHGYTLGRGLLLALACDIRIAGEDVLMGLPEVQLGMLPGGGGTQGLPRLVGQGRALHLILTGERIDAHTAYTWGLVTQVVDPVQVQSAVMSVARKVASNAPLAVEFAKEAIRASTDLSWANGLQLETGLQAILRTSEDWSEGIRAFKEHRPPHYVGR